MKDPFELLAPTIFVPSFIVMWCGVCVLIAKVGGWSSLATKFRATEMPSGEKFRFCAAKFGFASYNGILTAIKSDAGLHLSVLAPWRLGHPALFIPWAEMRNPRIRKLLMRRWVIVDVSATEMVDVRLPEKLIEGRLS